MQYKAGDVVRIKKRLPKQKEIDGWYADNNIQQFCGNLVKIVDTNLQQKFYAFVPLGKKSIPYRFLTDGMIKHRYLCSGETLNQKKEVEEVEVIWF